MQRGGVYRIAPRGGLRARADAVTVSETSHATSIPSTPSTAQITCFTELLASPTTRTDKPPVRLHLPIRLDSPIRDENTTMRGPVHSSRSGVKATAGALALLPVLALAGCKGIDKSQWRDYPDTAETAKSYEYSSDDHGNGTTVVQQQRIVTNGDYGVVAGSEAGSRRTDSSSIAVGTDPSTCWVLVVDGNAHRGCGDATISDTRGKSAGRVTKLSGDAPVELSLDKDGTTVDSGVVRSVHHYVTVTD